MLLFGHIGITLGIFFVFSYIAPQLKTIIDKRYLVIGALLPDLIDKPLGLIVFASTISNGRMISHTLLFSITLFLIGLYFYNKRNDIVIITLASGSFFSILWKIRCGILQKPYSGLYLDGVFRKTTFLMESHSY
ncbi:metal-dependent hydrolase [Methanosarcina barkeri]|uniref:metal-dependent hydrolase n=1 Tax=Methanosarcina barkeri TaxID=2208 RepID=UPI000A9536EA|nr:metal-dependent hydrolase [Methanosarcina barkeri]